ncbi:hypothetical protein GALMADRAFT_68405 [Galerina marginata CBS 339.88]|uniref:Inositol phospholipid synthesis and fat-storage-inducing TM-domain-containing protein n=1 Tax=Galerina marginata (strain CBS 339.88) TaxID=685588 RepID=A0A067SXW8_GALM3|nr:hypothetical protein GALMADRAFT_68405 [Galerina marginata CBS 339.88]
MVDIRHYVLIATTVILLLGTLYSVTNSTYLDTSNPLLTHLPHKLASTHYFASKANPLNVFFIKKAWGWTTLVFALSYLTSPPSARIPGRVAQYLALTAIWMLFTSWFFGPALLDRIMVASGGDCVYLMPGGELRSVPAEVCYARSAIAPETHPQLFAFLQEDQGLTGVLPEGWRATPRLRRGHDLSGHVFLLTMSVLFLADQLRASFRARERWSEVHKWAVAANVALMGIWLLGCYTTSVYFHTPIEKFTGYLLGVASFAVTQLPIFNVLPPAQEHPRRD